VKDGSETSKRVLEPRCSESEEVFLWDGVEEILDVVKKASHLAVGGFGEVKLRPRYLIGLLREISSTKSWRDILQKRLGRRTHF